jgi:3-dehydroquinate dehydratase / shikimate dehydrogenase
MDASIVGAREVGGLFEFRLDYLKPEDLTASNVARWVELAQGPVVLTLRRRANGGEFDGSEQAQVQILKSLRATFIDIEIETIEALFGGSLASLKSTSSRWIASYHNFEQTPADLAAVYRRLKNSGADVLKIAAQAASFEDNFRLLDQAEVARRDGIPIIIAAMGELGTFSRLMATGRGSLWTYASIQKGLESAPGQFTASELKHLYAVDEINESTQVYGVVGWPVGHSLSPHIHNPAFRQLGLNARYLPFSIRDLRDFAPQLKRFSGFSVTIPHKVQILDFVDVIDETVRQTGAANTLVNREQKLFASNTDVYGTRQALRKAFEDGAHTATLLGTGGAARAAAVVLKERGCAVTVLARDAQKAQRFAEEFGFASDGLNQAGRHKGDLLINATSVGMSPRIDDSPLPAGALDYRYVFDMIYNPLETRLLREARRGSVVISGVEMFVAQAARQFELWTGQEAPTELMRGIVLQQLGGHDLQQRVSTGRSSSGPRTSIQ